MIVHLLEGLVQTEVIVMSIVSNCLTVVSFGEARTPFLRKDFCRELSAALLQIVSLCYRLRLRDSCPCSHAGSTDKNSDGWQSGGTAARCRNWRRGSFI